jgi:putative hemolysin
MNNLVYAALGCALILTGPASARPVAPAHDAFGAAPAVKIKGIKKQAGAVVKGQIKQTGTVNLSSSDCTNVGGKVITVADDRCGTSRQYCRMPDTNAVCIDKVN